MAGHSKFKNIQFRKGAQDKKRSKIFAKLGREIMVAAKMGSPDPASNPRLRLAIQAARAQNMPKDNIERAIKRSSDTSGKDYENVRYEGFGPEGIGIIVEALTDNRNRTASEVRSIFSKSGGNLGETGSVSFMFDRVGSIEYPASIGNADLVMEAAIEAGANDCDFDGEIHEIICEPEALHEVTKSLEKTLGEANNVKIVWKPKNTIEVTDDVGEKLLRLIDSLEDNDDVQQVYANFELSDKLLDNYDK